MSTPMNGFSVDLDYIVQQIGGSWEELRGKRLFMTGGTGFFGRWLLESFLRANQQFGLHASVLVLTRDAEGFRSRAPHIANDPAVRFLTGDVRSFSFPDIEVSHVIHAAATSAVDTFKNVRPLVTYDIIASGTKRALECAVHCHANKFLLTSSGSIYGKQPSDMTNVAEDYPGAPDPTDTNSVIGEAKRASELFASMYAQQYGMEAKIARCFSFVGPFLQLDIHYAIGNFIRDGLNNQPIRVKGDGTPFRSYLYTADLIVWLWTILFKGKSCRAYNVGSEDGISIAQLASAVARHFPHAPEVLIASTPRPDAQPDRYVPSTERARTELGLRQNVSLDDALIRTIEHVTSNRGIYFR